MCIRVSNTKWLTGKYNSGNEIRRTTSHSNPAEDDPDLVDKVSI
jgi:hypothetical protein